jgi:cytochrome c oxidase assembly factor CtaG
MAWPLDPSVYIGLVALVLAYVWLARGRDAQRRHYIFFGAGVLLIWAALETPIDTLADDLLTAHMVEHMVLYVCAPPLLLLGLTPAMAARLIRVVPPIRALTEPLPAVLLSTLGLLFWHVPSIYDAGLQNGTLHICEHLTFLVVGVIFWWPLLASTSRQARWTLSPLAKLVYLALGSLPMMAVALVLQFAPGVLYTPYLHAPRVSGFLTPHTDQTVGGAVMMFMDMSVMIWDALVVFFRWFRIEVEADFAETASPIQRHSDDWEQMQAYLKTTRR